MVDIFVGLPGPGPEEVENRVTIPPVMKVTRARIRSFVFNAQREHGHGSWSVRIKSEVW